MLQELENEFELFSSRINLILLVDNARSGNSFFQNLLDGHSNILTCTWIKYVYSYIVTEFGDSEKLPLNDVLNKWPKTLYFSTIYLDSDETITTRVSKWGGSADIKLDRALVREVFHGLLKSDKDYISRKKLILATYFSFAKGMGYAVDRYKFLFLTDAISLRTEDPVKGFSGKITKLALNDFPKVKLIQIQRDPRAGFASATHEWINKNGNMYGLKLGNFWSQLLRFSKTNVDREYPFIYTYWLLYFRQTFLTLKRLKAELPDQFYIVKNEDLNLNFVETIKLFVEHIGAEFNPLWKDKNYQPTIMGVQWRGAGAYNSSFQQNTSGMLKNDSDNVSQRSVAPNEYVTRRWKSKLKPHEIKIIEYYLADEIKAYSYGFMYPRLSTLNLFSQFLRPMRGEIPTLEWIHLGFRQSYHEFLNRIFYIIGLPIFYTLSRYSFSRLIRRMKIF